MEDGAVEGRSAYGPQQASLILTLFIEAREAMEWLMNLINEFTQMNLLYKYIYIYY